MRRNAARGVRALAFSEIPAYLGLPSIHDKDRYWDPLFAACAETGTVVCMHIGSSSRMPSTSDDAPPSVGASLSFNNAIASLADFLFSGVLVRFPDLKLAYSEGQIGWIPYILERCDDVWSQHGFWTGASDVLPEPPSHYYYRQVFGCFFSDRHGIDSIDVVGADNITFETDYPHTDSTWPNTETVAKEMFGHLAADVVHKIVRGNAIRMLDLDFDLGAARVARGGRRCGPPLPRPAGDGHVGGDGALLRAARPALGRAGRRPAPDGCRRRIGGRTRVAVGRVVSARLRRVDPARRGDGRDQPPPGAARAGARAPRGSAPTWYSMRSRLH